jgi:capsular exopolysaccharide synthesis family protein
VDTNEVVQRRKEQVQEAKRKIEELDNRYGRRHPRVIDAESNLSTLTRELDRQIGNVISGIESQYDVALSQVRSLESDIRRLESSQFEKSAGAASLKEAELARDTNKAFYEDALTEFLSYEEKDLLTVPMSVTDKAIPAKAPSEPKKTLIILLGFLLGVGGVTALVFVFESLRETIQGVNDVEKKLGLQVFGVVPLIKGGLFGGKSAPLIPGQFKDNRGTFAEAIWTVQTSATVAELEEDRRVIMVTSSVPGEGKSTLAVNLAHALSELDNVVLVEADMRRPGLGKALQLRSHGLKELLTGEVYLEDAIRENAIGTLDVIPAGKMSSSPGKLLAMPEFAELMDVLKERYDRILIDLAPVQAVSDALVVGKHVDTAIYVVKADSTPMPIVKRGIKRLQDKNIPLAGAVISQVDFAKLSSYGGDYYYQGYYDYYGYAEDVKSERRRGLKTGSRSSEAENSSGLVRQETRKI